MASELKQPQWIDDAAQATRVTLVDTSGTAYSAGAAASVQRTTAISRVNTATTTNITAGKKAYTVAVITVASAASPTLGGVALPVGSYSFEAPPGDTLDAKSLVTVLGDDVIITSIT